MVTNPLKICCPHCGQVYWNEKTDDYFQIPQLISKHTSNKPVTLECFKCNNMFQVLEVVSRAFIIQEMPD